MDNMFQHRFDDIKEYVSSSRKPKTCHELAELEDVKWVQRLLKAGCILDGYFNHDGYDYFRVVFPDSETHERIMVLNEQEVADNTSVVFSTQDGEEC